MGWALAAAGPSAISLRWRRLPYVRAGCDGAVSCAWAVTCPRDNVSLLSPFFLVSTMRAFTLKCVCLVRRAPIAHRCVFGEGYCFTRATHRFVHHSLYTVHCAPLIGLYTVH